MTSEEKKARDIYLKPQSLAPNEDERQKNIVRE
jgi:hypothetical protein